MRISISPDENPGDPGTTVDPQITERALNVQVATALEAALKRCGQDAWFDGGITYEQRVARANSDGTHLLVACAHNAGGGEGTVFLFCPGGHADQTPNWRDGSPNRQDQLAAAIGDELVAAGISGKWTTLDEDVYECCQFAYDTAYVEILFMDSARDREVYHQPGYPVAAAEAIARGIAKVYGFAYVAPAPAASAPPPPPPPAPAPAPAPEPAPAPAPALSSLDQQVLAHVKAAEAELWRIRELLGATAVS